MDDNEYNILDLSSPIYGKQALYIEKIKKSKNTKNKVISKFHENYDNYILYKQKNKPLNKFYIPHLINNQLQKYNSTPTEKNIMIINDIIETKSNHFLAKFKDFLISDYIDEFLKRYFIVEECKELIPKFFLYYKNYLKFFCRGFFIDFKANKIMQDNGELQAELYYNDNYGTNNNRKKGKKKVVENSSGYNNNGSNSGSSHENKNNNNTVTNRNISNNNKIKLIFSQSIRKKLSGAECSKMQEKKEISNIFYKNINETITLNNDTKIYNDDNIYTNENSLINLLNILINKKKARKKLNENKILKNNINEKNIVNIYKNLLSQSPIKTARYQNYIRNGIYNKTSKKISSIKIFNKNIPIIFKNKNHNLSNDMKTPFLEKTKIISRNNQSKISRTNFSSRGNNSSNIFVKNSKSKNSNKKRKNNSKSILTRLNIVTERFKNNNKYSTFNKNLNRNKRKKSLYTGFYFKNMSNNSSNSSRNIKKNFICSFQSNNNTNNNKIKNYQYMAFKNRTINKIQNKIFKHNKQNSSLYNSNSIYNNFHININNNIMLLNNNNIKHYISNKNNIKSHSKTKKNNNTNNNINNHKKTNNNTKSRNENKVEINKYKTEFKNIQVNLKKNSKNNICSSIKKNMQLEKPKNKNKDKSFANKEQMVKNKNNLHKYNSRFKLKQFEKVEMIQSLKDSKKLNNSNKNLNARNAKKINIIFDYKRK